MFWLGSPPRLGYNNDLFIDRFSRLSNRSLLRFLRLFGTLLCHPRWIAVLGRLLERLEGGGC